MSGFARRHPADDRGDTLVELLVTLVIVSLAVVALLGGLLTSTSISVTHRHISNLDAILRGIAETSRYEIETQSSFGPSSGPQFLQCASPSQYKVVSAPNPDSGGVGTAITVFTLGLTSPWTVTVGGKSATVISSLGDANGTTLTFAVPTGLAANSTYSILINGVQAATAFAVNNSSPTTASPLAAYNFTSSMQYWDGSGFTTVCQTTPTAYTRLQQLTIRLAETETNNAASDHFDVTLADLKPLAVPTVTVTPPGPFTLGSPLALASAVTGVAGVPAPTGQVSWTLPNGTMGASCPGGSASSPTTCTVPSAGAGNYYAQYSGDANYVGEDSNYVKVNQATPVITLALTSPAPPTSPVAPADLTYTATFTGAVVGFAPTGSIAFTGICDQTVALSAGSPPTATCSASGVGGGTNSETAAYQPGTDPNYSSGTPATISTTVLYATTTDVSVTSSSSVTPATLTFKATVSGSGPNIGAAPAAITWSPACPTATALSAKAPYTSTCTVAAATPGSYSETATYTGNSTNASSSGSATQSLQVSSSTSVTDSVYGPNAGCSASYCVKFTATVTGTSGTPTGAVTWSIATQPSNGTMTCTIASPNLDSNGQATCTIDPATHNVTYTATASYSGDSTYSPSSGTSPKVRP